MLKRVLMFSGAGLLAGALSLAAANHTSAQGPAPATPEPIGPQYVVIPELGIEEAIPLELVPLVVRTVAQQAADVYVEDAEFTGATFDTEGPLPVFELAGTGLGGQAFEIDVFSDGRIEEVELALGVGQELPQAVTEALDAYLPNFSPDTVAWSLRPQPTGLSEIYYEFSGVNADGTPVEIAIREDGAKVHIEQATADDNGEATPTPSATTTTTTPVTATATATAETTTPTVETPTAGTATATAETTTPTVETPTAGTATATAETATTTATVTDTTTATAETATTTATVTTETETPTATLGTLFP